MEVIAASWDWNDPRLILALCSLLLGSNFLVRLPKWLSRRRRLWRMARKRQEAERWAQTLGCWTSWHSFFCGYVANHARHFRLRSQRQDGYVLPTVHDLRTRSAEVASYLEGAYRTAFNAMVDEVANLSPPDVTLQEDVDRYARIIVAYINDARLTAAGEAISRLAPRTDGGDRLTGPPGAV